MVSGIGGYSDYSTASIASTGRNIFQGLDRNGDDSLDLGELSVMAGDKGPSAEELMKVMDTDEDGLVSKTESDTFMAKLEALMIREGAGFGPPPPPPEAGPSADELFGSGDADEDGSLDLEELTAMLGQSGLDAGSLFDELDSDGDGLISSSEFSSALEAKQAAGPPPGMGASGGQGQDDEDSEDVFNIADVNQDGYVDAEELAAYLGESGLNASEIFSGIDTDGDGLISRAESEAAQENRPAGPAEGAPPGAGPNSMGQDWKTRMFYSILSRFAESAGDTEDISSFYV